MRSRVPPVLLAAFALAAGLDAAPRALPEGVLPDDRRLAPPRDLNGYFPFRPPPSAEAWGRRSAKLRHALKVAVGLYPEPTRTPLNAVVHGLVDGGDFTVERVYLETLPGFYLTGSLYRPKANPGVRRPGVLCPHGHWPEARFSDVGEERARGQIAKGAERHMGAARNPKQARCVGLARLGCTVFHYDMLGYCDNDQIPFELAHRFAKQRPEMIGEDGWGLYSPQAESWLQSVMMLQSWNSIRAIDFLESLPDIDPERIAATGASGGGTQTFVVSALDPRVRVSMPAVMVSTAMQGGCTCENACLLRVAEGNVALAALSAPRPLGLTAADDWTRGMATEGYPQLRELYGLLGVPDRVMLHSRTEFGHNYNLPSRQAMYRWFNEHLGLGHEDPAEERPHVRLTEEQLTVWGEGHPRPEGGPEFERALLAGLAEDASGQIAADPEIARRGWEVVLGADLESAGEVGWDLKTKTDRGDHLEMAGLIDNITRREQTPAVFLYPKGRWDKRVVIWLHRDGKAGLFDGGAPRPAVAKQLAAGHAVCGIDLFMQGEFLTGRGPVRQTRRVKNDRGSAAYTFGYNRALFVQRLRDVLATIKMVREDGHGAEKIDLVGLAGAGHFAAAANFAAGGALDRVVVETAGFEFIKVRDIRDPDFLPGGARYGDIYSLFSLAEREPWWVDENGLPGWLR